MGLKTSLKNNWGCKVVGTLIINKAPGSFKFSPFGKNQGIAQAIYNNNDNIGLTHVINRLQFGEDT